MSTLNVGAAKVVITPRHLPVPCWGEQHFDGVFSDIYVKAIYMENNTDNALILVYDLAAPYKPDEMKDEIENRFHIPAKNILISGTHNHTAPLVRGTTASIIPASSEPGPEKENMDLWMEQLHDAGFKAAEEAIHKKKPARYGFGEGSSYVNVNRDHQFEDGYYVQAPNMRGFSDKTLAVIKFIDLDGKLIAAFLNYGVHATIGFRCKDKDGKIKITGNVPQIACDYAENRFSNDAVIVWSSGAAGDQGPVFNAHIRNFLPDGLAVDDVLPESSAYQLIQYQGQLHGIDAIAAINNITSYRDAMPIWSVKGTIDLLAQKAPAGADMMYNRCLVDNQVSKIGPITEKKLVVMEDDPEHPVHLKVQLMVLGDIALFGMGAEPYSKLGWKCKEASPFRKTVIVTLSDAPSAGYILDEDSADHTSHSAFGDVKPGVNDERILLGMNSMFDQYFDSQI